MFASPYAEMALRVCVFAFWSSRYAMLVTAADVVSYAASMMLMRCALFVPSIVLFAA